MMTVQKAHSGNRFSFALKSTGLGIAAAIILSAGAGIATTTTAEAGKVVKKRVFGVGYAQSRHRAKRRAVKAWTKAAHSRYGRSYANFSKAHKRKIRCEYIGYDDYQYNRLRKKRSGNTRIVGNPDSPWTCTAKANPVGYRYDDYDDYYPKYKKSARGIGYGRTEAGARGLAVRAWTRVVRRTYGSAYARFSNAKHKRITCEYIGRAYKRRHRGHREYGYRGEIIGQAGDVYAPWTCTAKGRPKYSRYYY